MIPDREQILAVWGRALAAVDPRERTTAALRQLGLRRARVIGVGKAAGLMCAGAVDALHEVLPGSFATVSRGAPRAPLPVVTVEADHPYPTAASAAAGDRALEAVAADGPWILLLSGGASALWTTPPDGVPVAAARARTRELLRSGLPIAGINAGRAAFSRLAAGGLLRAAVRAPEVVLLLSDVQGDDPAVIGSGPCWPGAAGPRPLHQVIGSNRLMVEGAVAALEEAGIRPARVAWDLAGPVAAWSARLSSAERTVVEGGEPEVRVGSGSGRGGRCTHLALLLAREIAGRKDVIFAALSSDGVDGESGAAGAVVDGTSWEPDGARALERFDAASFLHRRGALVPAAPTGVNVNDLFLLATSNR